ncbi:MAG: S49 family peptidase [Pseudomonadota bacterium]|nr:S49 family peptidase [Pseudomonadota bacterium]
MAGIGKHEAKESKEEHMVRDTTETPGNATDQGVLISLALKMLEQQRRDLKWRNIRMVLLAAAIVLAPLFYLLSILQLVGLGPDDYAAVVRIDGMIGGEERLSAQPINKALTRAFEDEDAKGVVLLINSPGGTPVQSSLIYERLMSLRQEHPDVRVIAVGEDMLTSGAYFVAAAADRIYVNQSTITGSIGMVSSSFGLTELIAQHGVERRVIAAGTRNARMDAWLPMSERDKDKIESVLDRMHAHFIASVKAARGDRLRGEDGDLFSGDYWTGDQALSMGLVDGISDLYTVIDEQFGVEDLKDYTPNRSVLDRIWPTVRVSVEGLFGVVDRTPFRLVPRI